MIGRIGKTNKRSRYAARACNESEEVSQQCMETAIKVYKEDTKIKTEEVSQQCMEAAIKVYKEDTKIKTEVGRNGKTNKEDEEMVNGKWKMEMVRW